jgi:uncharacterized membrane protein YvlD (DUF360 family)
MGGSRFYKWALALLGTVFLGAVGSGLWDAIIKPILPRIFDVALNISTLGLEEVRNEMYGEIARGNYERAGLITFQFMIGAISGKTIALTFILNIISKESFSINYFSRDNKRIRFILSRRFIAALLFVQCLVVGFMIIDQFRVTYIVEAAAHIHQIQEIVYPVISEDQRKAFISRAAQISSRDDYEKMEGDIKIIAEKHDLKIPIFTIF